MEDVAKTFYRRQQRVAKRHRRMADGYVTRLNENGIFEQRPARDWRGMMIRPLLILVLLFLVLKLTFVVYLGFAQYEAHLVKFQGTSVGDLIAHAVMQIDPVTRTVAEFLLSLTAPA